MRTEHTVSSESSVMFNLRQLMELEAERLTSEAEVARAAERAAEQQRANALRAAEDARLAEQRAAAERVRQAELEAQRVEQQREASLLRVQFEAEAKARIALERLAVERDRIAFEHARAIQREVPRRSVLRVAALVASLASAVIGGGALHAALFSSQPAAAENREVDARSATAAQPPQSAAPAEQEKAASVPAPTASTVTRAPAPKPPRVPSRQRAVLRRSSAPDGLEDIDFTSNDPLEM